MPSGRTHDLTKSEKKSIKAIAFALDRFEPFTALLVSEPVLRKLVEKDLAQAGPSCRPAVAPLGYRLTESGWSVAEEIWTH